MSDNNKQTLYAPEEELKKALEKAEQDWKRIQLKLSIQRLTETEEPRLVSNINEDQDQDTTLS